jgi:hypothetical protein
MQKTTSKSEGVYSYYTIAKDNTRKKYFKLRQFREREKKRTSQIQ